MNVNIGLGRCVCRWGSGGDWEKVWGWQLVWLLGSQLLTVLQRESVWYCMRGLRPRSPRTTTQTQERLAARSVLAMFSDEFKNGALRWKDGQIHRLCMTFAFKNLCICDPFEWNLSLRARLRRRPIFCLVRGSWMPLIGGITCCCWRLCLLLHMHLIEKWCLIPWIETYTPAHCKVADSVVKEIRRCKRPCSTKFIHWMQKPFIVRIEILTVIGLDQINYRYNVVTAEHLRPAVGLISEDYYYESRDSWRSDSRLWRT